MGAPNVGKSSWFNTLVGDAAAIVTQEAGTTRDLIKQSLIIGSQEVQLIDSAGIRETKDLIEKEGVRRTEEAIKSADLILWVLEKKYLSSLDAHWKELFHCDFSPQSTLLLVNKVDTPIPPEEHHPTTWKGEPILYVSSLRSDDRVIVMKRLQDKISHTSPLKRKQTGTIRKAF